MMAVQSETDSLFTSDMADVADSEIWKDIRLIHESERGWSVVYTGLYRGRRVAIKGLKPEYRSSELHHSLLHKEFEVTSALNHQNIVAAMCIEDVPETGEAMLLEYIEGMTLSDYLDAHPSLEVKQIVDIVSQLCSAVGYMHTRQTIHCDLKPSNIMITTSGFLKVIDFGMSRGNGFERLDFTGGTRGFTAPENFDSDVKASVAVDIYSIGKLLEQMDRKGEFKDIWKKCLSSDPEKRPASVCDIQELINLSLTRIRHRRILYRRIGIALGISVVAGSFYLISASSSALSKALSFKSQLSDDSKRERILKDLMLQVQNGVEITEEEKRMIDTMSYTLGQASFDCGEWLINEARSGGVKGADHAQWAPFHFYHLSFWLDEEYGRLESWVGVFLNNQAERGGIEVRFYIVCESQDKSLHTLLREKLNLLPGEKRDGDFWWFAPASDDLQQMHFISVPDREAIRSRIEQMLESLNVIPWP